MIKVTSSQEAAEMPVEDFLENYPVGTLAKVVSGAYIVNIGNILLLVGEVSKKHIICLSNSNMWWNQMAFHSYRVRILTKGEKVELWNE